MARTVVFLLAWFCFWGCNRSSGPKPLTLEELPAAMTKAFQTARPLLKQNSEGIVRQIQEKQYAPASIQLQTLLAHQDLTDEQREVASAAVITINKILQEQAAAAIEPGAPAQEQPRAAQPSAPPASREDAKAAAAALEYHIRTK